MVTPATCTPGRCTSPRWRVSAETMGVVVELTDVYPTAAQLPADGQLIACKVAFDAEKPGKG